jgi:glycosyltransferase involved in cell wall biosynthesis
MERTLPLTLLLPVKNAELFLPQAILQVEANLSPVDQVIVIDDGSSDSSIKLVSGWADRNPQVMLNFNPGNGLVDALNFGVSLAKYEWVARFDVDDTYLPNRLKLQEPALVAGTAAVFSDYQFIGPESQYLGFIPSAITPAATKFSMLSGFRTPHPSVIFSKLAFNSCGGYQKEDYPAEDLGLWLRMANFGKLTSVGLPTLNYRLHANSITLSNRLLSKLKKKELLQKYPISADDLNDLLLEMPLVLKVYKESTFSDFRLMLLIRELLIYLRYMRGDKGMTIRCILFLAKALSWTWPLTVFRFVIFKAKRTRVRS